MNAIIFFMSKKFISIILVIVISFTAFISAPVSVYASVGGYSWEDYYDLDSDGNYTFNDAFYALSTKAKVYVILDTLQNADDKVTAQYIAEDDSAVNALSYIAWVILSANGIVSDFISDTGVATSIVSVFVDLFDSGEIVARSGGGFTVSSSAVNTIRETYVDDYRIDVIDNFNVFCYGSFFGYDDGYSEFDIYSSDENEYYATNTDVYSFFWNSDFWNDTQNSNKVFIPRIQITYDSSVTYPFTSGNISLQSYKPYTLQVYVPTAYASDGSWHITRLAAQNDSSSTCAGILYYDGGDLYSNVLINKGDSTYGNTYFSFTDTYEGVVLPNVAATSLMYYDVDGDFGTEDRLYWYCSHDTLPPSSVSDTYVTYNYLNLFAQQYYDSYFSYNVGNATKLGAIYGSVQDSDYIYYTSYYNGSSFSSKTRLVMLSADAKLENDVDGTSHNYNTPSDNKISDDALDDAQDGDSTNSPSISIPNDSIENAIDNYDEIIEAVEEDDSTENVASVVNNYIAVTTDDSSDDSDDDSDSGSSSSSSSDDSDSGTILEWLEKIYNKLCEFYSDAMSYLSDIKSVTVDIKAYLYVVKDDLASLYVFVTGDLYDMLSEIYSEVGNLSTYASNIYTRLATTNSYISTTNSRLASILTYVQAMADDLAVVAESMSDIVYYLSYDSEGDGWLYDIAANLTDGWSSYYGYGILETMYNDLYDILYAIYSGGSISSGSGSSTDYSTILSSLYNRLDDLYLYFTGDLRELLTNLNNYVVYLYEEVSAFPDTLAELFSDYFMDSYYVSQTVFEIIRGDLDLLYQMLAGETDSVLSNMQDSIDALAEAIASITSDDSEVSLSGIKGHLKVIETLLTGIAALLAVDTVVDLLDFTSEELGDYLDNITDSIGEVTDAMTDVFPFCVPWDILAILALFSAEPEAPVFELPITIERLGIDYSISVDLSEYEQIALICRTILTCLFVVGLGYLTIRITGGSGGGGDDD